MIFKSEKWELDTEKITVRSISDGTIYEFYTDHIRYHLHHSEEHFPERLQQLVDNGEILEYLEELEIKVTDEINEQTEIYMKNSKEYQTALDSGNLVEVCKIGNMLREKAKESVYNSMIYI
ncbi:MAG: hypothetical protein K2G36_09370 [Ruminococcus sp.]|nr:hypothetical protein [Ruminococcus sp.]